MNKTNECKDFTLELNDTAKNKCMVKIQIVNKRLQEVMDTIKGVTSVCANQK